MGVEGTEGKRLLEALGFFINGGASLGLASGLGGGSKTPWRGDKVPCRARMGAGESRKRAPLVREETAGDKPSKPRFFGGITTEARKRGVPAPSARRAPRPDSPAPQLLHGEAEIGDRRELILKERLNHGGRGGGRRREKQEAAAVGSARGGIHRSGNGNWKLSRPVPAVSAAAAAL